MGVSAVWKFPRFCDEPGQTDAECLHELVVMFSHFIQETGGKRGASEGLEDGLYWQREMNCYNPDHPHCANDATCRRISSKLEGKLDNEECSANAKCAQMAKCLYNNLKFLRVSSGSLLYMKYLQYVFWIYVYTAYC